MDTSSYKSSQRDNETRSLKAAVKAAQAAYDASDDSDELYAALVAATEAYHAVIMF